MFLYITGAWDATVWADGYLSRHGYLLKAYQKRNLAGTEKRLILMAATLSFSGQAATASFQTKNSVHFPLHHVHVITVSKIR